MKTTIQSSLLIALVCLTGCASAPKYYTTTAATTSLRASDQLEPCRVVIQYHSKYDPAKAGVVKNRKPSGRGREDLVLQHFCDEACRIGADLVNIKEEKQSGSSYFAKVEYVRFNDRDDVRKLRSDISYDGQYINQRVQQIESRKAERTRGAMIGGALGGAVGAAIGAAAAGN